MPKMKWDHGGSPRRPPYPRIDNPFLNDQGAVMEQEALPTTTLDYSVLLLPVDDLAAIDSVETRLEHAEFAARKLEEMLKAAVLRGLAVVRYGETGTL